MDSEFQELEDTLKAMRPASPDAACLDRLLAAVEGRLQSSSVSISGIESRLAAMQPVALSAAASARMLETVSRVPFPVGENVVLFPGASKSSSKAAASRSPWYAAAAAVAVAGAFSALMVGGGSGVKRGITAGPLAEKESDVGRTAPKGGNIVSASRNSGLQDASDQGVRWTKEGKPMRVVRVIYRDRVKMKNGRGEIIEVEQPRVEYLMVPEKID